MATLRVSPLGAKRLAALSSRGAEAVRGTKPGEDGWTPIEMAIENNDHGARELLRLGAEVEVISPASFRERVHALAVGIASLNGGDEA
jgi:predicted DNA-binding transcriptional regulator YafY